MGTVVPPVSTSAGLTVGPGQKMSASFANSFRVADVAARLATHIQCGSISNATEFFGLCLSIARLSMANMAANLFPGMIPLPPPPMVDRPNVATNIFPDWSRMPPPPMITMATNIVPEHLASHNYANWRIWMKNYLLAHDLWDVIEEPAAPPNPEETEAEFKAWRKKNAAALHAIHVSCSLEVFSRIREIDSAKFCWETLATMNEVKPAINRPAPETEEEVYLRFRPLCLAIEKGDCNAVISIIKDNPGIVKERLTRFGSTALHLATRTGNVKMVEGMLEFMSEEDLELVDNNCETALIKAAATGIIRLVECLINKNRNLLSIPARSDIPITTACGNGLKDMTHYLYSVTPFDFLLQENGAYGSTLLQQCIFNKMFDIALDLVRCCPRLATTRNFIGTTPLIELSVMTNLFPKSSRLAFWQRWIYSCINVQLPTCPRDVRIYIPQNSQSKGRNIVSKVLGQLRTLGSNLFEFSGLKHIYDMKLTHTQALQLLHCIAEGISTIDDTKLEERGIYEAFFKSIQKGIIEVVIEMVKANPSLLIVKDKFSRNILLTAVQFRQERIFSLVYALDARKYVLLGGADSYKNNMLHMAAMLAPPDRLARISGAALQMQRELQWYKEVESIVNPAFQEFVNQFGDKASQLFVDSHKLLMSEGEKWMKDTATSCTVVGALIITIMFTAAFTVPGGNIQDSGFPIFLHKKSFTVFIISDAISLFASSTSVLMFLGVLTSRYAEDDFLKSLPTKLIIGLSTLFVSIAAMMVAFCATLIIMLRGELNLIIPIVLLASIPVTLFIFLQFPLLVEIFVSTYGPGIFERKMKYWYK